MNPLPCHRIGFDIFLHRHGRKQFERDGLEVRFESLLDCRRAGSVFLKEGQVEDDSTPIHLPSLPPTSTLSRVVLS